MLYMVELHYQESQREPALSYFEEHGFTHYEQNLVIQGAWVATRDRIAYLVVETDNAENMPKAVEPLSAFGEVTFRPVIKAEQI